MANNHPNDNNPSSSEEGGRKGPDTSTPTTTITTTTTTASNNTSSSSEKQQQPAKRIAHRHHHKPGHGKLHYRHHHHHHCCDRQKGHTCASQSTENDDKDDIIHSAPNSPTFGGEFDRNSIMSDEEDFNGQDRIGVLLRDLGAGDDGVGGVGFQEGGVKTTTTTRAARMTNATPSSSDLYNPPHTAPLRMMSDPEQYRALVGEVQQILKANNSRNLLNAEGRHTPAPSYSSAILPEQQHHHHRQQPQKRSSSSAYSTSTYTTTSSSALSTTSSSKREGVLIEHLRDEPIQHQPFRTETMNTNSSNESYGVGRQTFVANPLLDAAMENSHGVGGGAARQSPNQHKVHFQKLHRGSVYTNTTSNSDHRSPTRLRTPNQTASHANTKERPTRSPFRLSHQSSRGPPTSRHDSITSYGSGGGDLQNRDKRISAMIEDCLPKSAGHHSPNEQALRKRNNHHTNNKRESGFIDQILGFDKMTPGDLIYGEGSKVDGGFGFAIPSSMARESTILLDSREDRKPVSHKRQNTAAHQQQQSYVSDSQSGSSRFSSDTESIASTISQMIFNRRGSTSSRGGDNNHHKHSKSVNKKENGQRASTSSFDSSLASISNRFRRPSSLSDRVNNKDIRPTKLDLNRQGARGGKGIVQPSHLRESMSISEMDDEENKSSATWEDVQLDTGRGKNERLANAVGVRLPTTHKRQFSNGEDSRTNSSDLTVIEEEDSNMEQEGKEYYPSGEGDLNSNHVRSGYSAPTEKEARPTYISGASDSDGFRATMNLPPGLSQADIVAICLVQGMVPPGLPPDDTLVSWSGPLSPTNPRNWSTFQKWYACILVSWSTFLANAATNMIAPALGIMSVDYKILYTMWIRGSLIGSYIFAFTFAPLIFGPMSEIMGRKPVLIFGSSLFAIACLLSGYVTAVWQLMILRFLSALGASAPMSIGGAVLTDIFSPDQRGRAMTLFALAPQFGPVLGPIVGGWITQESKKWRWIFFTAAICGFTAAVPMVFVRESYTPRILANRAKKLRKETGNDQLTTIFERRQETKKQIITRGVVRPLVLFSCEPLVQLLTAYVSLIYGIIHLMVATFPAVFSTIYSEEPGWASMHFINIGIGTIAGGFAGGYLVERHYHTLSLKNRGVAKPEFKFYCMLYTVWIPPFGLMGYGLMTWYGIHWIFVDCFIFIFCFGISIAVVAVQSYMVDCYALLAGSALTATIVFRSIVGTGATIGSEDLLLHGGMLWSNVALAAACVVVGVPCAYAVYFMGASMRQKSRHATHKR